LYETWNRDQQAWDIQHSGPNSAPAQVGGQQQQEHDRKKREEERRRLIAEQEEFSRQEEATARARAEAEREKERCAAEAAAARAEATRSSIAASNRHSVEGWSCEVCSTINPDYLETCQACGSAPPVAHRLERVHSLDLKPDTFRGTARNPEWLLVPKLPGRFYAPRRVKESFIGGGGYVRGYPVYGNGITEWLELSCLTTTPDGSLDGLQEGQEDWLVVGMRRAALSSLKDEHGCPFSHMVDQVNRPFYVRQDDVEDLKRFGGKSLMRVYGMPFAQKREWFKKENARHMKRFEIGGAVEVTLHRGPRVLEDSKIYINNHFMVQVLRVQIIRPDGSPEARLEDDAGGIYRAWVKLVADRLFHREHGLFEECTDEGPSMGKYRLSIKNRSKWEYMIPGIEGEAPIRSKHSHSSWCEFAGNFLGKVLFDGAMCPTRLVNSLYMQLLKQDVSLDDYSKTEPAWAKQMEDLINFEEKAAQLGVSGAEYLEFSCLTFEATEVDAAGKHFSVPLKPGGADVEVKSNNVTEYVGHILYYKVRGCLERGTIAFCHGFWEAVQDHAKVFTVDELESVMCGQNDLDVDDWQNNTLYKSSNASFGANHKTVRWFFQYLRTCTPAQRADLLLFATGSRVVPIEGFAALESKPGTPGKFTIQTTHEGIYGHTCANLLDLPTTFPNYETFRDALVVAVEQGIAGEFQERETAH